MIKRVYLFAIAFLLVMNSFAQRSAFLDSLLGKKGFFLLRDTIQAPEFNLSSKDSLYYYSYIDNFFNRSAASNTCIEKLMGSYSRKLSTDQKIALLKLKIDNHVKTYQYAMAHRTSIGLLNEYSTALPKDDKDDIRNTALIWKSLAAVPAQQAQIGKTTQIPFKRDIAGLLTVPVNNGSAGDQDFVFDTGANISVITETNAVRNKLKLLNSYFAVTAITGLKIKARCGIAPLLRIGDITLNNVVFLVFPDSALSFGTKYKIEGIIGFPVIEQLGEIRINKKGYMEVPLVAKEETFANLGLDELTPIIQLRHRNDLLPFTFDTGGQQTFLNLAFFKKYKQEIETNGKEEYLNYGGAGGTDSVRSYEIKEVLLQIADKNVRLNNISTKTVAISPKEEIYYGNLGQDAINQFDEVIISFKYMYVALKNIKD